MKNFLLGFVLVSRQVVEFHKVIQRAYPACMGTLLARFAMSMINAGQKAKLVTDLRIYGFTGGSVE